MKLLISKNELIIQQARNNPISHTFRFSPIVALQKAYSITFLKKHLGRKK